ncbi:MAG: MBL fold metallo-hydrolase [Pseudomonadota bacterium]
MAINRRQFLKWTGVAALAGIAGGTGSIVWGRSRNSYYSGPISDHFDGLNFFNPNGHPPKGFIELMKWQLGGGRQPWPDAYPSPYSDTPPERVTGSAIRMSFVGHATVLIQTEGVNILTDPVWAERASPFQFLGPVRRNAPGVPFEKLPPIDAVLLSHNHYDHLDLATLSALKKRFNTRVITPLGNDTIIHAHDTAIPVSTHDWGETVDLKPGIRVHLEPMHHWSARSMTDRRNALWAAFVIETPSGLIYHVGDTGFHDGRNYIAAAKKYGGFRAAILPFGAYEPRGFMQHQHQNPDEAVQGHLLCQTQMTLGHHWGTFRLTNESIDDQLNHLEAARQKHGVSGEQFRALRPGQVVELA